jgi:hypothetical protein
MHRFGRERPPKVSDSRSINGNEWTGALQADGEYTVRIYLMRSAARRKETARYTLTVGITGSAAKVKAGRTGDTWSVEVNDYEHYQIPDALISGG